VWLQMKSCHQFVSLQLVTFAIIIKGGVINKSRRHSFFEVFFVYIIAWTSGSDVSNFSFGPVSLVVETHTAVVQCT
jgi:hypothetical protein